MPQYQLLVSVVLVATALCSASLLFLARPSPEGKIKLPEFIQDGALQDPFDVTKPEDVIDGEPIDEADFWARVRAMLLLLRVSTNTIPNNIDALEEVDPRVSPCGCACH